MRPRSLLASLALLVHAGEAEAGELQVHFLNVGQGASTLVIGPDGTRVLVDGGNPGDGDLVVRPYLLSLGVTDLDWSIVTHYHPDHVGGIDEVFAAGMLPDVAALDRGDVNLPASFETSQYLAAAAGVRQTAALGQTIPLGDGAELEILAVNGEHGSGVTDFDGVNQEENGRSVVSVIRYGHFECFVGGDVTAGGNGTADVEGPVATLLGRVEVAQSSHHGSNTSSSATVVGDLDPSFVVHSCGLDNDFGHPTKAVTSRWSTPSGCRVQWSTTEGDTSNGAGGFGVANGHVVVTTDGVRFRASRSSGAESIGFTTFENPGSPPVADAVVVSEILVDPAAASDADGEWFELRNVGIGAADLGGVQLASGGVFVLRSRVLLQHGERLVVGLNGRPSANGGLFVGLGAPWELFSLPNGTGSLEITSSGSPVDGLAWGGGGIAVTTGASAERADLFAPPTAANFVAATTAYGGGDLGTPWAENAGDASAFTPIVYAEPPATVGGSLDFLLHSLDEPGHFYFLGLSTGIFPGFDAFGFHVPLNLDPLFLAFLAYPDAFGLLDASGERTVSIPLQADPSLAGFSAFAHFLTLELEGPVLVGSMQSNLAIFGIE